MFQNILAMLGQVITFCFGIFAGILNSVGLMPVFLGIFAIICIVRFILLPLLGGGGMSRGKSGSAKDGDTE